jgi:hypothetical protein
MDELVSLQETIYHQLMQKSFTNRDKRCTSQGAFSFFLVLVVEVVDRVSWAAREARVDFDCSCCWSVFLTVAMSCWARPRRRVADQSSKGKDETWKDRWETNLDGSFLAFGGLDGCRLDLEEKVRRFGIFVE